MSKKRGFTLTEVLVVIAITTLIMTMLGTTFVFMATSSGDLIHKSEELTQTQSIETYLRSLIETKTNDKKSPDPDYINGLITTSGNPDTDIIHLNDGNLWVNGKVEFKDTGLKFFEIDKYDKFIKCKLGYNNDSTYEYEFILGLYVE